MEDLNPRRGLAEAQHELAVLMDELENTLDLVQRLSSTGEDEVAISLIDKQRDELYRVVDSISQEVAKPPTRVEVMRRHLAPVAAAAALVVASVAISISALNRPTPVEEASAKLDQASTITDVRERLTVLIEVYETTRTLPTAESEQVAPDLADALSEAIDDVKGESIPEDEPLIGEAEEAVEDLESGQPPAPPSAPGQEQGPVETLKDIVEDGP